MVKCKYCKTTKNVRMMGVNGKFDEIWTYCKEHYVRAKAERDAFLVKKGLPIYDRTKTHEEYHKEFCEQDDKSG